MFDDEDLQVLQLDMVHKNHRGKTVPSKTTKQHQERRKTKGHKTTLVAVNVAAACFSPIEPTLVHEINKPNINQKKKDVDHKRIKPLQRRRKKKMHQTRLVALSVTADCFNPTEPLLMDQKSGTQL